VLLVEAMAHNASEPAGSDVWLSCEAADGSAEHLTVGIADAFGMPPGSELNAVFDRVWARAPERVCLVLDDVHEIPPGSGGAAVLDRLLEELPANGHVVLASRDAVPVRTARLAATNDLERVRESDLLLDPQELAAFAAARGVDPGLLTSTGGWPALAELTASAGKDLVLDYLWEEVLDRVGADRAKALARLSVVDGGDDDVVAAITGQEICADDLVASVPLVERSGYGWVSLHPLWRPALRVLLTPAEAAAARRTAAGVHRERSRLSEAVDLLVENEAWEEALAVFRDAEMHLRASVPSIELGRWRRLLPPEWRKEPEALLAAGLERQPQAPLEAVTLFEEARTGFRNRGDVEGEVAAIAQEGLVRWWANDLVGLLELVERIDVLAQLGSGPAAMLAAIGRAGVAHLGGDSDGVFTALTGLDGEPPANWPAVVHWLRSVAHRRNGDLAAARRELDTAAELPAGQFEPSLHNAALHIIWLEGQVESSCASLAEHRARRQEAGDHFLAREATLELALRTAWLGDAEGARELLREVTIVGTDVPSVLQAMLLAAAEAAAALADGDEASAAERLHDEVVDAIGGPTSWYWRDRAALGLVHVLVPETRAAWADEPLGPVHEVGLRLAELLEAVRDGDLSGVGAFEWTATGLLRAHLPLRWLVELAAAGVAAGNPPPRDVAQALGTRLRPALLAVAATSGVGAVSAAAARWASELPAVPEQRLRVNVLGPLELLRAGEADPHPTLRRQRVRQLLSYLVMHRRTRRETVATDLWPELDDGRGNLRVTLSYLQQALQPDRSDEDPPYFLRSEGGWLELVIDDRLEVDAWQLEAHLDAAEAAERQAAPGAALAAYRAALPLWRGEPYVDVAGAAWAIPVVNRLRGRYVPAAVRAGELLLARGEPSEARFAAHRAIEAELWDEPAYRLLIRTHLADGNRAGATRALEACRAALAELDAEPELATLALLDPGSGRD